MKFLSILSGLILMSGLGFSLFSNVKQEQQLATIKLQLSQLEKENANIRDQWVAWQRQETKTISPEKNQSEQQQFNIQLQHLKQGFEFVQFAMQQQQWVIALQHLEQIEQQLDSLAIAEPLKLSLQQSIAQDRVQIKTTYQQVQQQQQTIQNVIQQLENTIQNQIAFHYQAPQQRSFWQRLWIVEKTPQPTINTAQYQLLLKEIQLDMMILKSLNVVQNPVQFQQILGQVQSKMQQLPTPILTNLETELQNLMAVKMIVLPKLTSLDLLGASSTP